MTEVAKPDHDGSGQVIIGEELRADLGLSRVDRLIHRHHGGGVEQRSADVLGAESRVILEGWIPKKSHAAIVSFCSED